ncbi:MAG: 2Fe-2S iron-sulfur cluster binding domain-containing protein [Kiritimatiellae bacterium]|nr:2Fe-2S iron-sulfur cluster binding domain-containing protein [Kiritimatiellia bacterium]
MTGILQIIADVLVVSGIAAGLALLLVLAERVLVRYGECRIRMNAERELAVQGGRSLLEALVNEKLFIPSACGGRGTCGYCKVRVLDGAGPLLPTEEPYLTADERAAGVRLSCQVRIRNDLRIELPPELLAVREYACVCGGIADLTHDIKQVRLELSAGETLPFTPGQYVQLLTPPYNGVREEVYRAYSVASDPADTAAVELIIRLVPGGICTTYVFEHLKQGDTVRINGPYGEFRLSDTDAPVVFIAGGSGMAPIKSMLHAMRNSGSARQATYFFGVNKEEDLFLVELMREFEAHLPAFRFVPVVAQPGAGSGWSGETGLVTEAVRRHLRDGRGCEAYLCGSPGMIDAAVAVLRELGTPADKIYYDKFA